MDLASKCLAIHRDTMYFKHACINIYLKMRDFIDYGAKQIVIIHLLLYYFDSNVESIL